MRSPSTPQPMVGVQPGEGERLPAPQHVAVRGESPRAALLPHRDRQRAPPGQGFPFLEKLWGAERSEEAQSLLGARGAPLLHPAGQRQLTGPRVHQLSMKKAWEESRGGHGLLCASPEHPHEPADRREGRQEGSTPGGPTRHPRASFPLRLHGCSPHETKITQAGHILPFPITHVYKQRLSSSARSNKHRSCLAIANQIPPHPSVTGSSSQLLLPSS